MIKPTEGSWLPIEVCDNILIKCGDKTIAVIFGVTEEDWENAKAICTAKAGLAVIEEAQKLIKKWGNHDEKSNSEVTL